MEVQIVINGYGELVEKVKRINKLVGELQDLILEVERASAVAVCTTANACEKKLPVYSENKS